MLREWERKHPGRIESIFNAMGNVAPSHLLDRTLFDFAAVRAGRRLRTDGDTAFDVDRTLERAIEVATGQAVRVSDRARLSSVRSRSFAALRMTSVR